MVTPEQIFATPAIDVNVELFKRGQFDFICMQDGIKHTKQEQALQILTDNITREFAYGGAAGGAKSWTGAVWIALMAIAYPGTRWFAGRLELKQLRDSTFHTFLKVFKKYGIKKDTHWKYNGQDNYFYFTNGSQIDFIELKYYPRDPYFERFGSKEYTGGWIEEAGEIPFAAYDTIKTRVNRHLNDVYKIVGKVFITLNPKKNWVYTYFWKPFKEGVLIPAVKFLQAFVQDNPFIDTGYIDQLRSIKDKIKKERLLFGNFDYEDDANALMMRDAIEDLFNAAYIKPLGKKYITGDIARFGKDTTTIYVWDGWLIIERHVLVKKGVDDVAKFIKQLSVKHEVPMSQIVVDEDGVGCLTTGTKVLTERGWINVESITIKNKVYSKDASGNLALYPVIANTYREETDVIKLKNGIEFSYSHFLPLKTRKEYEYKNISWDGCIKKGRVYTDSQMTWQGHETPICFASTEYCMPNGGIKSCDNQLSISAIDFAAFIGWFVSEGSLSENYIRITQNTDSPDIENIRSVLHKCGFNFYEKQQSNGRAIDFTFRQKALYEWLKVNCYTGNANKCYYKRLPAFIRTGSKTVIEAFLKSHNSGDGYFHHGKPIHITVSQQLAYDIQECMFKIGKNANIRIKQKAGSQSKIGERVITRSCDCFLVSEIKEELTIAKPKIAEVREERVYNLEIDSPTKLYLVLFDGRTPFFVHNGGVVDILRCKGFVNNSTALENPKTKEKDNYKNLKTQCSYMAAEVVNKHETGFAACFFDSEELKEKFIEEAEQVKRKDPDSDGKLEIIPKEVVKELIGRSPDDWDCFMMRQLFELKPKRKLVYSY